jgi:outer membrane receptor protein involved in Fe transport
MPIDQAPAAAQVVVTAQLPPAAGDPAFSIVAVDPPVLKISDRLDDALTSVPGFTLFRRTSSLGANPTTQGVSLRGIAGSGASRALVTLDGVPQNDPFGGWVIWTGLPPETIASAAVVRGAGSGAYGSGALTGVVALQSPGTIGGGIEGDIEGGELGYARAAGLAEIDTGPTSRLFLDATGERSNGWIPVVQGRGAADRPLTLRDWSAGQRFTTDLGGGVALSERVAGYQEDRGAGSIFAGSTAEGAQGSVTLVKQPSEGALGWRLQAWASGSNLVNTSASVAANRNTATLADDQFETPAYGVGFNAAVRRSDAAYSWEVGVDARDFDGSSHDALFNQGNPTGARVGGGGEWIAGAYAEGSRTLGPLLLTGGVRLDGWETYDSSLVQTGSSPLVQHPADRSGAVPTGRVGLRRDIADGLYLRAAAYAGFRMVTLNELHRSFRVGNDVTEANAGLSPEKLYGVEGGVGGLTPLSLGRFSWDADVFYNRLADAVTNVTIGKGPGSFPLAGFVPAGGTLFERENAGTVNAWGVEGDADYGLGAVFDLRAAFAYTHARVDGGTAAPQLTGLRPAETPAVVATADANWRAAAKLILTAELRYESSRFDDDQNTRKIDGGAGLGLRAEWRFTRDLAGFLAADNVTNANLQTGRSAAGVVTYDAPRMVRAGLSWRR